MSYLDLEIKRVIKYAEGLGIKVSFQDYKRGDGAAEWHTDGSQIIMYVWPRKSKTMILLDFIHELAHHHSYVNNRRRENQKINSILEKNDFERTRYQRKLLYEMERDDSEFQEAIFDSLALKIPKYKMYVEKDLSNWIYYRYYQAGDWPTGKEVRAKRKELNKKYKEQQ